MIDPTPPLIMKMLERLGRCVRKLRLKHWILLVLLLVLLLEYLGLYRMFKEKSFVKEFSYPLEGDVSKYVNEMKRGDVPSATPVYKHDYYLLKHPKAKCLTPDLKQYEPLRILYLVKSAANHFEKRETIRKTWGFEKRFADVPIRTVFLLGQAPEDLYLQGRIEEEFRQYQDLVQGSFTDAYFNNSLKTAMGLRWAAEYCSRSRFYMFVDDDYYVSTRNLLRFLRNPVNYPGYLEEDVISFDEGNQMFPAAARRPKQVSLEQTVEEIAEETVVNFTFSAVEMADNSTYSAERVADNSVMENLDWFGDELNSLKIRNLKQLVDFDLPKDVRLFAGYVFPNSRPHRHRISKWYIPLEEYPYDRWPPYVTAGAYILSRAGLVDMYYTSYFTKLFRFDDIWLGLIALKAGLEPLHSREFYFERKRYSVRGYKYVVASHGFSDHKELGRVWNQQKEAGNA